MVGGYVGNGDDRVGVKMKKVGLIWQFVIEYWFVVNS